MSWNINEWCTSFSTPCVNGHIPRAWTTVSHAHRCCWLLLVYTPVHLEWRQGSKPDVIYFTSFSACSVPYACCTVLCVDFLVLPCLHYCTLTTAVWCVHHAWYVISFLIRCHTNTCMYRASFTHTCIDAIFRHAPRFSASPGGGLDVRLYAFSFQIHNKWYDKIIR